MVLLNQNIKERKLKEKNIKERKQKEKKENILKEGVKNNIFLNLNIRLQIQKQR